MPQFDYTALDHSGREVRGVVEAEAPRAAAAQLKDQRLFVLKLQAAGSRGSASPTRTETTHSASNATRWARMFPVTTQDRMMFLKQLGLMLRTGLTLLQALDVCRQQATKPHFAAVIERISQRVRNGTPFSAAVGDEKKYFPEFLVKLLESAEASGEMDITLDRAAQHLERRAELQAKLLSSMIYPAVVVLTSIGVAAFLVFKVVPKFAAFFARRGGQLPWATQFLMDFSSWLIKYGPYLLLALSVSAGILFFMYLNPRGRYLIDRTLLYIPVIGSLLRVGAMAQFSQTLAMLLRSGLTLLESLRITGDVVSNRAFRKIIHQSSEEILKGRDLSSSLRERLIPPLVVQVVAVGEQTGALSEVLSELSDFYDQQLQIKIRRMSALIEPLMILIIGGMVGFVYFAFFQAVLQLATGGR